MISDTIRIVHDTIYAVPPNLLDIVEKIDGFYSNAWNTYTTIFGLVGVLSGIAFPLFLTWLHDKRYIAEKKEFNALKSKIDENNTRLKDTFIKYSEEIKQLKNQKEEIKQEMSDFQIRLHIDKITPKVHFRENPKEIKEFLESIESLQEYKSIEISQKVFDILKTIIGSFIESMTPDIASSVCGVSKAFFPLRNVLKEQEKDLGMQCTDIGFLLVYDTFFKKKKLSYVSKEGLLLLKTVYREGNRLNIIELQQYVREQYENIESNLEKKDVKEIAQLEKMKELVRLFKEDLETPNKVFPKLSDELEELTKD